MKVLGIIFLVLLVGIITYLLFGAIMFYAALSDKNSRKDLATIAAYAYAELEARLGRYVSINRKRFINMFMFGMVLVLPVIGIIFDK